MVSTYEIAWAAGFFDGEGCSYASKMCKKSPSFSALVSVNQVNRNNLERFQEAIGGLGKIYGPYTRKGARYRNPQFIWQTTKFEHAQAVIALLWKFLGREKRQQAIKMLTAIKGNRPRGINQYSKTEK